MHPYRDAPVDKEPVSCRPLEEVVLYVGLVGLGVLPVALALIGGKFGSEATLGAILAIVGACGLAGRR